MNARAPEPTPDQLQAMAYVDGELPPEEREAFELRLRSDAALGREVAELRRLEVLARKMAPPEPADLEWARLGRDPLHRGGTGLGFALLALGSFGLGGVGVASVVTSDMNAVSKVLVVALVAGAVLLFLTTLRARLRVLPFDPYTQIDR